MAADDRVNGFFKNSDLNKQRKRLSDYLILHSGGANHYEGDDLKKVHANMGVTQAHYDVAWHHIESSLQELKVDEKLIAEVKTLINSFAKDIITK